jgi:fructokinase
MPDVVALGELLIDFVPTVSGVSLIQAPAFVKAPGGAPANVAVGLARLGLTAAFMGQVGDDAFGHFLSQTLSENKVDVSALRFSPVARTALAFVSLKADGDRDFMFYRHPSADMLYRPEDVDETLLSQSRAFHFGSISLISDPSRSATLHALGLARASGQLISYDPNLRMPLWPSPEAAREGILLAWPLAQLIKVSEEELAFLSGQTDLRTGAYSLWHDNLQLLIVTEGKGGCTFFTKQANAHVPSFEVAAVDTTGAGDAFVAGLLKGLLNQPETINNPDQLTAICRYANAVGALTTTQRGAIPAMPTDSQVADFLNNHA